MESTDWKQLFADDGNFTQDKPYNLKSILDKLDKVTDLQHFNPYYLLSPIYDFTKIFKKISSGLAIGFKDITEKVNLMRKIFKDYPDVDNIQDLVLREMSLGIHELTGGNNKEKGHKNDEYKKYISASRTFLRLLWFMEFLIKIFRKLVSDDDKTLKEILKNSYNEVLAPRHTKIVRTAVAAALTFAGKINLFLFFRMQ
ncbi:MAG: GLTP domain-containing protein [archaeon]|nr:GLTP domain-containing protein [archaeon]